MCLYTNNISKRNSYLSTKEIARLLALVAKGEKLPEGEGKASYFYDGKADLEKQLKYFAEVVRKMADIKTPDYELTTAAAEDEEYIYSNAHSAECGYIGRLRGDFGRNGTEFWSTWENGSDELNTVEFRVEFDDVLLYLKERSDTPILKDRRTMQYICGLHGGYKLTDKFADIHLFKIATEKCTYFIRCFYGVGDYNFYIFAYNNEKLRKYKDIQLIEKYRNVLDKDKFFKTNGGFTYVYYNPDATAGGWSQTAFAARPCNRRQLVYNEISYELIREAYSAYINVEGFFDYLGSACEQTLVDIGTEDFHDSFMNFVNDEAEFEGCVENTMDFLREAAYRDLYSYSIDDNNVLTVWEGKSVLCTISDVSDETAEDMFKETVFELRGISLDD